MSEGNDCYDQNLELESANAIDLSFHEINQLIGEPSLQNMTVIDPIINIEPFFFNFDFQFSETFRLQHNPEKQKKLKVRKSGGGECSICQAKIRKNTKIPKLTCKHIFHKKCLQKWIKVRRNCPLCRDDIQ